MLLPLLCAALVHSGYAFPNLSLTVSSLAGPLEGEGPYVTQRQLEIVWEPMPDAEWMGIFTMSPPQNASQDLTPMARINPSEHPGGYYRTNISFHRQPYPNGWNKGSEEKPIPGDACMPFWVAAYNKNNELLHSDCIKIRPTWMGDHREKIKILTLGDLFIPGTDNSGTYNRAIMDHKGETVGPYVLTQDTDVWGQLVHGIRYLDLHIRHYPGCNATTYAAAKQGDERYRKLVNVDAVTNILEDIKYYLKKTSYEIVILGVNEFPPGFEGDASSHRQFVSFLHSVLGEYVLPFSKISYNSTLAEVWKTGRNLIVAYKNPVAIKEFDWLWSPIPHMCTRRSSPEHLKVFLQQCIDDAKKSNKGTLWAAMAAIKPTPIDFVLGGASSIRELASMVNRNLTRWFLNEWWKYTSIVASDFFLGNTIIDTAVKACVDKANILAQAASEE